MPALERLWRALKNTPGPSASWKRRANNSFTSLAPDRQICIARESDESGRTTTLTSDPISLPRCRH